MSIKISLYKNLRPAVKVEPFKSNDDLIEKTASSRGDTLGFLKKLSKGFFGGGAVRQIRIPSLAADNSSSKAMLSIIEEAARLQPPIGSGAKAAAKATSNIADLNSYKTLLQDKALETMRSLAGDMEELGEIQEKLKRADAVGGAFPGDLQTTLQKDWGMKADGGYYDISKEISEATRLLRQVQRQVLPEARKVFGDDGLIDILIKKNEDFIRRAPEAPSTPKAPPTPEAPPKTPDTSTPEAPPSDGPPKTPDTSTPETPPSDGPPRTSETSTPETPPSDGPPRTPETPPSDGPPRTPETSTPDTPPQRIDLSPRETPGGTGRFSGKSDADLGAEIARKIRNGELPDEVLDGRRVDELTRSELEGILRGADDTSRQVGRSVAQNISQHYADADVDEVKKAVQKLHDQGIIKLTPDELTLLNTKGVSKEVVLSMLTRRASQSSEAASKILRALTAGSILGNVATVATLVGVGAALYYATPAVIDYFTSSPDLTKILAETEEDKKDLVAKLKALKFIPGTEGGEKRDALVNLLEQVDYTRLQDRDYLAEKNDLVYLIAIRAKEFLEEEDEIKKDLESEEGWEEALDALDVLIGDYIEMDESLKLAGSVITPPDRGSEQITRPSGELPGRGMPRRQPKSGDRGIPIFGDEKLHLSAYPELSVGIRNNAQRYINLLKSKIGLAFWDPEMQWGGGVFPSMNAGTISDQVVSHMKWFDSKGIQTPGQLKRWVRKNIPGKMKRNTAIRDAMKDAGKTRRRQRRESRSNNIDHLFESYTMKNKEKIKNSTNKNNKIEKYADSFSKEYYQDALRDLDDQYAKSYYTGLKSMYDHELGDKKVDYKLLYEPNGGTGKDIVEKAHPKSVVISDSMGRGGLVENIFEQQRHDVGVALSAPTGNFRGKYANLVDSLLKIANAADENGENEISKMVNSTVKDIVSILKS